MRGGETVCRKEVLRAPSGEGKVLKREKKNSIRPIAWSAPGKAKRQGASGQALICRAVKCPTSLTEIPRQPLFPGHVQHAAGDLG